MIKNKHFQSDELRGQSFREEKFIHCRFSACTLRFTTFDSCTFSACDFVGCDPEDSTFTTCSFPESRINQLDLSRTFLKDCDFSSGLYVGTRFAQIAPNRRLVSFNLKGARFHHADLTQSVFEMCNLKEAEFASANLKLAIFHQSYLEKADFASANLDGTSFSRCRQKNTRLDIEGFISFGLTQGFIVA